MIREPKGASLKNSKKNHLSSAGKKKKLSQKALKLSAGSITSISLTPPSPLYIDELHFDCGIALLSRQFDRDRDRVLERARTEGHCFGLLTWFSDVEKQSLLSDICKTNSGFCYFATGIHPDNIDRTNKKLHDEWLEKIEELGKKAECLALLSGLNLNREIGTHFSQESLFSASVKLARKLHLPLVLHLTDRISLERAVELLLTSEGVDDGEVLRLIIYDVVSCSGMEESVRRLLLEDLSTCPGYATSYVLSGVGITDGEESIRLKASSFLSSFPVDALLVATDAPWKTPQNLSDAYLRTLRNESANIESIVKAVADVKCLDLRSMSEVLKENSLRVFGLDSLRTLPFSSQKEDVLSEVEEDEDDNELGEGVREGDKEVKDKGSISHPESEDNVMKCGVVGKDRKRGESMEEGLKSLTVRDRGETAKELRDLNGKKEKKIKPFANDGVTAGDSESRIQREAVTGSISSASTASHEYKCVKCRSKLFTSGDITTHEYGAAKTVFKVGEEGLCAAFCFVPAAEGREIHKRLGVHIRGGNVECGKCGMKVGKYCSGEAICGCGSSVVGPVAKINTNKIDLSDQTAETSDLLERLKTESELVQRQLEIEDEDNRAKLQQKIAAEKAKKVKKHKSENRGNFSNFRNKSFIPNASKVRKNQDDQIISTTDDVTFRYDENDRGGSSNEDEAYDQEDN